MAKFKKYTTEAYVLYINSFNFTRNIKKIQLHHTFSPSIKQFTGNNHLELQEGMKNYHINSAGYSDIAQNLTIFPDGAVVSGRALNTKPAGIKNANTGAICIECLGDFESEDMPQAQKDAIVNVVKALLKRCSLSPEDGVAYHAWYSGDGTYLGDYKKNLSQKTCPGRKFFGGNTRVAFEKNLMPLLKGEEKMEKVESANDIIWDLMNNSKINIEISDVPKAVEALEKAKNENSSLYWILYKIVNKLRGAL